MVEGLEIEWTGHSGFFILDKKKIYIDPFQLVGEREKADIILVTHSHYDHCSIEDLRKIARDGTIIVAPADCQSKIGKIKEKIDLKIMEPGQELVLGEVKIKAIPSYNVGKSFHTKADYWNGYLININGKKVYHSGDSDLIPEMNSLEGDVDIALLPVSGITTMNAQEAMRAAVLIRPKVVIPMHYGNIMGGREDSFKFLDLCDAEGITCKILERK
ncbi:MBL fold metallo-hydrolase [Candidatus Pacearchaeota archaeon]|nr:MBL fold metallo-hydrolase [Candidatus Pacearchaeota archaeon]